MTAEHPDTAGPLPPYSSVIQTVEGRPKFRNLDDKATFAECASSFDDAFCRNSVVDFGVSEAWAAFDLGQPEVDILLKTKVVQGQPREYSSVLMGARDRRHYLHDGCMLVFYGSQGRLR